MDLQTLDRRDMLRISALAGLGAAIVPKLAFAADADISANVRAVIEKWVGPGKFPGMVAAFGLPGKPTQFVARGAEGFTDPDPMTPDSLFRVYSMTKPITGMATMMLIGDGKLGLDQPLADILPKFANMQVQNTPDGSITDVHPAKAQITVRHLLTHTAGLGYAIMQQGPIKKAYSDAGLGAGRMSRMNLPIMGIDNSKSVKSLTEFCDNLAALPLVYDPGSKWSYSCGLDVLGRVIEVVSGLPFDQFLKRRIFDPCGMASSFFQVPAAQAKRLTTNYGAMGTNLMPIDEGAKSIYLDPSPPYGGSGLVSSPRDYDRFLEMLTSYGRIGKARVMGELAVRVGTGNLLPDGVTGPAMMGPVSNFGAGGRVGIGAEAGIYGWAGAAGTVGTVDMRRGLRSGIFVQFMPPNANSLLPDYAKALQADVAALSTKA
jgi:CubicO group peptidase (beta-lactamase class C family)